MFSGLNGKRTRERTRSPSCPTGFVDIDPFNKTDQGYKIFLAEISIFGQKIGFCS